MRAGPAATGALPPTEPPRAVRAVPAATMQAFLDAWLDELPVPDALRLGAACRRAREALGAGGVAAAAFAVTRPWRAEPEASLRLWRRAWEACASASSALGLRGGAWLKTGTVLLLSNAAVTLDLECARELAHHVMRNGLVQTSLPLIAILLISGKRAVIHSEERNADAGIAVNDWRYVSVEDDDDDDDDADIIVELQMLLLLLSPLPLARPVFAAAIALTPDVDDEVAGWRGWLAAIAAGVAGWRGWLRLLHLAENPLDVCDTVIADGLDTCLLVPQFWVIADGLDSAPLYRWGGQIIWAHEFWLSAKTLSSGMRRVAQDGRAYDLFDFAEWYRPPHVALERWREALPLAEVQDEREIALAGMLTRSAPPPAAASGAARGGRAPASGGRTFSERDF